MGTLGLLAVVAVISLEGGAVTALSVAGAVAAAVVLVPWKVANSAEVVAAEPESVSARVAGEVATEAVGVARMGVRRATR